MIAKFYNISQDGLPVSQFKKKKQHCTWVFWDWLDFKYQINRTELG